MVAYPGGGNLTGYSVGGGGTVAVANAPGGATPDQATGDSDISYWSLARCKRAYNDYLASKRPEILEQQEARRYRHGAQWTSAQVKIFNDRKQPVVTFNRLGRKIDGIVGLVEKLRRDPKAFPRNPRFQQSADLATAALRSCLEKNKWRAITPLIAESGAVDGIGGLELVLEQGKDGWEVGLEPVDITGFFYDPRSKKADFSDARYMGCGKWMDADVLKDMMPDKAEDIDASVNSGLDLTSSSDSDAAAWTMTSSQLKSVRLIYICYQHQNGWCWALFTGAVKLMEGKSYFVDADGKPICSYIMYSAAVDQDNDRYGFPRNLKSPQDEINQRRSKGLHELNTRRIVGEVGAFDDIEKARKEAVRPDGVVLRNKGFEAEFDDAKKQQDIAGQIRFLEDAKAEIENFGPNPALLGDQGVSNRSGRAIALMQQSGIAELGPYIISYTNWKLRIYEAVFCAVKKYWTGERWIRVSDDDGEQQMIPINQMQLGPYGQPQIVNNLGELDVDIMLDEGPDTVTMMEDMYETLSQIVPAIAPMLTPPEVQAVVAMLIETSPLPAQAKRKFRMAAEQAKQPNPLAQQMQQLGLADAQTKVQETQSKTALNYAKAQAEGMPQGQPPSPPQFELPPIVQVENAMADIDKKRADAMHKRSLALAEHSYVHQIPADMAQTAYDAAEERKSKRDVEFAYLAEQAREADDDLSMREREAQARRQQAPL